jgi:hypothetical protein
MAKQTFTTGQVLTAAQMTSLQQTAMGGGSATAKTASYVLVAADAGATVIMNAAGATTITVNTSLFSAGDTVFIQNIGAGISTITAGTATVNTASSLALEQYESGNLYFTAASAAIFSKADGAAAGGGGKVLQVVSTIKTDTFTTNSTSFTDITGVSVSITPSAATSKVLVMVTLGDVEQPNDSAYGFRFMRDSTAIAVGDAAGSRLQATFAGVTSAGRGGALGFTFLDSPATTSATTYKIQGYSGGSTIKINRTDIDTDSTSFARSASTITVMEIGA